MAATSSPDHRRCAASCAAIAAALACACACAVAIAAAWLCAAVTPLAACLAAAACCCCAAAARAAACAAAAAIDWPAACCAAPACSPGFSAGCTRLGLEAVWQRRGARGGRSFKPSPCAGRGASRNACQSWFTHALLTRCARAPLARVHTPQPHSLLPRLCSSNPTPHKPGPLPTNQSHTRLVELHAAPSPCCCALYSNNNPFHRNQTHSPPVRGAPDLWNSTRPCPTACCRALCPNNAPDLWNSTWPCPTACCRACVPTTNQLHSTETRAAPDLWNSTRPCPAARAALRRSSSAAHSRCSASRKSSAGSDLGSNTCGGIAWLLHVEGLFLRLWGKPGGRVTCPT